jgi:nitrous oxidase accessory protein
VRSLIVILVMLAFVAVPVPVRGNALQARIDAAAPGDAIEVGPGVHQGTIIVKKSIKLIGHGWPIIDAGGKGDVLILQAHDCEVRGFVIRNSGDSLDFENAGVRVLGKNTSVADNRLENVLFGIDLKAAPNCRITGNHITSKALDIARRGDALRLFRSNDCLIEDNVIEHGRDALLWYSNKVTVRRNVSRCNRYGFHMMYANDVTFEANVLSDNSVGIYLMYGKKFVLRGNTLLRNRGPSGYGLGLKEIDSYSIESNVFSGNRVGCYIDGSPYTRKPGSATLTGNTFACNDIGITMLPAVRGNRVTGNNFVDNVEQVAVQGRGSVAGNEFAVAGRGNFWGDYAGYDANHDGVGDQPYRARKLFESLVDREPKLRLLLFSPAHDAIEFIARAVPAVQPEAKFADPSPLMQPVAVAIMDGAGGGDRSTLAATAAALVAIAALIGVIAFGWPARLPVVRFRPRLTLRGTA